MTPNPDLLGELNSARECVPAERWREFENFFIGALSNHCKPSVWRDALKLAKKAFPKEAFPPVSERGR